MIFVLHNKQQGNKNDLYKTKERCRFFKAITGKKWVGPVNILVISQKGNEQNIIFISFLVFSQSVLEVTCDACSPVRHSMTFNVLWVPVRFVIQNPPRSPVFKTWLKINTISTFTFKYNQVQLTIHCMNWQKILLIATMV